MYQPPPGRPVSSPPDYLAVVSSMPKRTKRRWNRMPDDVRQAIRADYTAGMHLEDIKRKHGLTGNGTLQRTIQDLPKRKTSVRKPQPPVRMEGESAIAYARRRKAWLYATDPAMRERQAEASRAAWAKRKRKAAAAKRKAEKEAAHQLRLAEAKAMADTARQLAAEAEARAQVDVFNAHVDEPVAPPPTLWQRITGWFR